MSSQFASILNLREQLYKGGKIMFARIHNKSDILENGKIMLLTDSTPGCRTLTDLQYLEHTLREVLVETHKSIQEAMANNNNFTFKAYVEILSSLSGNLKIITESILAVKSCIQASRDKNSEAQKPEKLQKYSDFLSYSVLALSETDISSTNLRARIFEYHEK